MTTEILRNIMYRTEPGEAEAPAQEGDDGAPAQARASQRNERLADVGMIVLDEVRKRGPHPPACCTGGAVLLITLCGCVPSG